MEDAGLKRKIIEKLNVLDEQELIQLLSVLENLTPTRVQEPETKYELEEWDLMPEWQKKRIEQADASLKKGEGIPHEEVMKAMKRKYGL